MCCTTARSGCALSLEFEIGEERDQLGEVCDAVVRRRAFVRVERLACLGRFRCCLFPRLHGDFAEPVAVFLGPVDDLDFRVLGVARDQVEVLLPEQLGGDGGGTLF